MNDDIKTIKQFATDHEDEFEFFAGRMWSIYKKRHNLDIKWLTDNFNDFIDIAATVFYSIHKTMEK